MQSWRLKMKISELKPGQGSVNIELTVKALGEVRTFNKYGKDLRVCNATVSDDSGEIVFSLWNADIDKVKVGDKLSVTNGYVSEFNGNRQLTTGKFGKLEVNSGSAGHTGHGKHKKSEEVPAEVEY